ncbi:MAG: hypothetical protein ACR2QQ_13655 [Gammaproteobacteria bacterium]
MATDSSLIRSGAALDVSTDALNRPESPSIWRTLYRRFGAHLGFAFATAVLVLGWTGKESREISAEEGIGYALGIFAVLCMVVLLVYPVRKRLRILKLIGPTRDWFRVHMMLGVAAPLAALYHCNFSVGSINSRVALVSALLVAGSGLIGRFLYAKVHRGLYGRKTDFKELLKKVGSGGPEGCRAVTFMPELIERVTAFDRSVLVPPKNVFSSIKLLLRLIALSRLQHWKLVRFAQRRFREQASRSPAVATHRKHLERSTRRYLSDHLRQVRRVAEFNAYERLFALWHAVHLPFFLLLVVSVVIHVWAVHAY